jgi:hypothetical protein
MVKRKGMTAGNRKMKTGEKINLKAPSYKWLVCRKCELNEVKVDEEVKACVCSICLTIACDYVPRVAKSPKKSKKVVNTFENLRAKEEKEAKLAQEFKKKKAKLKSVPKKRKKTKKKTKKEK